jgi:hypothetical protein
LKHLKSVSSLAMIDLPPGLTLVLASRVQPDSFVPIVEALREDAHKEALVIAFDNLSAELSDWQSEGVFDAYIPWTASDGGSFEGFSLESETLSAYNFVALLRPEVVPTPNTIGDGLRAARQELHRAGRSVFVVVKANEASLPFLSTVRGTFDGVLVSGLPIPAILGDPDIYKVTE